MNYLFGLSAIYERKLITKDGKNLRKYLEMKITGIICKNYIELTHSNECGLFFNIA